MDLSKKIRGASVLESLVAMTIVLLSITISAGVYAGLNGQTKGLKSVVFQNECEKLFNETVSKTNDGGEITIDNYVFNISREKYMDREDIQKIKIQVKDKASGKKVFDFNRLQLVNAYNSKNEETAE